MVQSNPIQNSNIAQWIERASHKAMVVGSNPTIEHNAPRCVVLMVTYNDLFEFVIMLCAVITLVIYSKRKK